MPSGFKLNSTTLKYNGLEEPEAWLDDYLIAVKFQRGTNVTAMQYVQLMLESSARHWLKNLPRELLGDAPDNSVIKEDDVEYRTHRQL